MMESSKIFPDGYHFRMNFRKPDLSGPARFYTRTQRPPKYFLIDFGMSLQYEDGHDPPPEPSMVEDEVQMQTPFQADVRLVGEIVREIFMDVSLPPWSRSSLFTHTDMSQGHPILTHIRGYKGFELLRPLINDMVQRDAAQRPDMKDVVKRFDNIVSSLSIWKLRSRMSSRRANVFQDTTHIFSHWKRKIVYMAKRTPPIPAS